MFEVHITTRSMQGNEIEEFIEFCKSNSYKPIVIELEGGEIQEQPMISKVIRTTNADVFNSELGEIKNNFLNNSYPINRIKIEVPLSFAYLGEKIFPNYRGKYGEWHAKIRYENEEDLEKLIKDSRIHVSRNSLKGERNQRIITYRHYGFLDQFENMVANLFWFVKMRGFEIVKDEFEYCIYDSNKSIDKGWIDTPEVTDLNFQQLLVFEEFLRRKSRYEDQFILKGSLVTRQFIKEKHARKVNDLDFVYEKYIDEDPSSIFSEWVTQITEDELNDETKFRSFRDNAFWRSIDYAMDDDFPTTNTDLLCTINDEIELTINLDISWNLPLNEEITTIDYRPVNGEPFSIRVVDLPIQISWKLHQSIVRPRIKDLIDLNMLLKDNEMDVDILTRVKNNFLMECEKDRVDPRILNVYSSGQLREYCLSNEEEIDKKIEEFQSVKTPLGLDIGGDFSLKYITRTFSDCPYSSYKEVLEEFENLLCKHEIII